MLQVSNRSVGLRFVVGAFALFTLVACRTPVTIQKVRIHKSPAIQGEIQLHASNGSPVPTQVLSLSAYEAAPQFWASNVLSDRVTVELKIPARGRNLPSNAAQPHAMVGAEIELDAPKEAPATANVTRVEASINGVRDASIECHAMIRTEIDGNTLIVRMDALQGLDSCGGSGGWRLNPRYIGSRPVWEGDNFYEISGDVRLGDDYAQQFIRKNWGAMLPDDHPTNRYLQRLMDSIAAHSDYPDFKPRVHTINADVLNAFALPGGQVFVFRGLLDASRSQSELVGVLAHEWAHVAARHGTKNVTRSIKAQVARVMGILAGSAMESKGHEDENPWLVVGGILTQIGAHGGTAAFLLHHSREAENEADELGAQYAWATGHEPWGLGEMFEVFLQRRGAPESRLEELLSDHPALERRIGRVHELSAFLFPEKPGYVHTSAEYDLAKAALNGFPVPASLASVEIGNAFANGLEEYVKAEIETEVKKRTEE